MLATTSHGLLPRLRPEGITWRATGEFLEVDLELTNESFEPTEAGQLVLEAAALGAFVPFVPVARVRVTAFEPFERRRTSVLIPAASLDAAIAAAASMSAPPFEAIVAADIQRFYELRRSGQWAGNLNIYFDRAPEAGVEVHRALEIKVEARREVVFAFSLDPQAEYEMDARPSDPAWAARVRALGCGCGALYVLPPAAIGARARVEVRVTRTRDDATVPVVFGLETVSGPGGSIGCVRR